jgi:hypothetical protein
MQMENGAFRMIGVGEETGGEVTKNPMPGGSSSWVAKEK